MAKINALESFTFTRKGNGGGKGRKYDWDQLLNGDINEYVLEEGDTVKLKTLRHMAFKMAKARRLKVHTGLHPETGNLVIQAYKPEGAEAVEETPAGEVVENGMPEQPADPTLAEYEADQAEESEAKKGRKKGRKHAESEA